MQTDVFLCVKLSVRNKALGTNKIMSVFLAYIKFFSYLCIYERASYGHI